MHTNPKENRTRVDHVLLEEFHRKGYNCEEIKEDDATIFIITYEKKVPDTLNQIMSKTYKEFKRAN